MEVQVHPAHRAEHADNKLTALTNIHINRVKTISNNPILSAKDDWQHVTQNIIEEESSILLNTNVVKDNFKIAEIEIKHDNQDQPLASMKTAIRIVHILKSYSLDWKDIGAVSHGVETFLPTIAAFVERQEPVRMVLPAFPFKSPNSQDKTLGVLPDLGEELALHHLNGLCQNVAHVYEHGAEVHITSDGLVYNDILGVPDEVVWDYGEALRQIAVEKGLHHLRFIRLVELLGYDGLSTDNPESAKAFYIAHSTCLRRELMFRFGDASFCARTAIKNDTDVASTYRGYIKFLTKDIAPHIASKSRRAKAKHVSEVARSMIVRGQMFAAAIKAQRGDYVRLSIHESTKSRKVTVPLIPHDQGTIGHTPWHSCVVVGLDGSYRAVHADQVRHSHELVFRNGRPYCYRERSELFDWTADGLQIEFEYLYPCGLVIRPVKDAGKPPSIRSIPMHKIRQLSWRMSPIICRGFTDTQNEDLFIEKGTELGKINTWKQKAIVKVRDSKRLDKNTNHVESNEPMPMHYDGMFNFEDKTNPSTGEVTRVQKYPKYQFFICQKTAPDNDGLTLFSSSRLFLRNLPAPWTLDRLRKVTWTLVNDGFWNTKIENLPLTVTHPESGLPCLRWHQLWDASKTKFSTFAVTIDNDDAEIVPLIDGLTHDYRVCTRIAWQEGDLLVNDNVSMLHTRTGYTSSCDRELWRIQCD